VRRAGGVEVYLALDPGLPPVVLILQKTGVGPLEHHGQQFVRSANSDQLGDVEFGRRARVFAEPDRLPVEKDVQRSFATAKMQYDAAAIPNLGQEEFAPVDAGEVVVGDIGRKIGEGHLHVGIVRPAEPLHGPVPRHLDGGPAVRADAGFRHGLRAGKNPKIPLAVQTVEPWRILPRERPRVRGRRIWEQRRPGREFVETGKLRHFPALGAGDIQK